MLNKLIHKLKVEDYFFVVEPKSEYNTTGKYELHNLNSEEAVMIGYFRILRALILDWFMRRFFY